MAHDFRDAVRALLDQLDRDLPAAMYSAVSLSPEAVGAELDGAGLARLGADHEPPTEHALDESARVLIQAATRGATLRGAMAGAVGIAAVPPEIVATLVQSLHLAQRLAVVYGHDFHTDRGRVWIKRALAEGFEVEMPPDGQAGVRVRDLPGLVRHQRATTSTTAELARALALRVTVSAVSRLKRLLPGVGAGLSALDARRGLRARGDRMHAVFRRSHDGLLEIEGPIEEAVEIRPGDERG